MNFVKIQSHKALDAEKEWSVQGLIYLKYGLKIQNINLLNQLIAW